MTFYINAIILKNEEKLMNYPLIFIAVYFIIIGAFALMFSKNKKTKYLGQNYFWFWLFILWIRFNGRKFRNDSSSS